MEEFGTILNAEGEVTASHVLQFFEVCCLPMGVDGNPQRRCQSMVIDIMLSEHLVSGVWACVCVYVSVGGRAGVWVGGRGGGGGGGGGVVQHGRGRCMLGLG